MPLICTFRGIRIYIYWDDHYPAHFHAEYNGENVVVDIEKLEVEEGGIPSKQLKMLLGWAAIHQDELLENWNLAKSGTEPFLIDPLK